MNHSILLIEDDDSIRDMIESYLTKAGFTVVSVQDGEQALQFINKEEYALILLDIMLPKLDGMEVLQQVRRDQNTPIMIMSAKDGEVDKAWGLALGADDYITKPFSLLELLARVKASIRRSTIYSQARSNQSSMYQFHDITIDPVNRCVWKGKYEVKLTSKEYALLLLLSSHPGRVYTKGEIYQLIWNEEYLNNENVINVHMRRLRKKIEDNPSDPKFIETLWGIGYRWRERI